MTFRERVAQKGTSIRAVVTVLLAFTLCWKVWTLPMPTDKDDPWFQLFQTVTVAFVTAYLTRDRKPETKP